MLKLPMINKTLYKRYGERMVSESHRLFRFKIDCLHLMNNNREDRVSDGVGVSQIIYNRSILDHPNVTYKDLHTIDPRDNGILDNVKTVSFSYNNSDIRPRILTEQLYSLQLKNKRIPNLLLNGEYKERFPGADVRMYAWESMSFFTFPKLISYVNKGYEYEEQALYLDQSVNIKVRQLFDIHSEFKFEVVCIKSFLKKGYKEEKDRAIKERMDELRSQNMNEFYSAHRVTDDHLNIILFYVLRKLALRALTLFYPNNGEISYNREEFDLKDGLIFWASNIYRFLVTDGYIVEKYLERCNDQI